MDRVDGSAEKPAKRKIKDKSKKRKKDKSQDKSQAEAASVDNHVESVQTGQDVASTSKVDIADTSKLVDGRALKKRRKTKMAKGPLSASDIMNSILSGNSTVDGIATEQQASTSKLEPETVAESTKAKANGVSIGKPEAPTSNGKSAFMELNTSTVDVMQQMKDRRDKARADKKGKGRALEEPDLELEPAPQEVGNVSVLNRKARKASRRKSRLLGNTSHAGTPDSADTSSIQPSTTSILPESLTKPSFSGHLRFPDTKSGADDAHKGSSGESPSLLPSNANGHVNKEKEKAKGRKRARDEEATSVDANDISNVSTASIAAGRKRRKRVKPTLLQTAIENSAALLPEPTKQASPPAGEPKPKKQKKSNKVDNLAKDSAAVEIDASAPLVLEAKVKKAKKPKTPHADGDPTVPQAAQPPSASLSPSSIVRKAIASLANLSGKQILDKAHSTETDATPTQSPKSATDELPKERDPSQADQVQSPSATQEQVFGQARKAEEKRLRKEARAERRLQKEAKKLKKALKAEEAQQAEEANRLAAEEEQKRDEAVRQAAEAEAERLRQAEVEKERLEKERQMEEKAAKLAAQEAAKRAAKEAAKAAAAEEIARIARVEEDALRIATEIAAKLAEQAARLAKAEEAKAKAENLAQEKEHAKAEKLRLKEQKKKDKEARKATRAPKKALGASTSAAATDDSHDDATGEISDESGTHATERLKRKRQSEPAQELPGPSSQIRPIRATRRKNDVSGQASASKSARKGPSRLFDEPSDADAPAFSVQLCSGSESSDADDETYAKTVDDLQKPAAHTSKRHPALSSEEPVRSQPGARETSKTPAKDFTTTPSTVMRSLRPRNVYGKASSATPAPARRQIIPTSTPVAPNAEEEEDEIISTADDSDSHYVSATPSLKPTSAHNPPREAHSRESGDNESSNSSAGEMEVDEEPAEHGEVALDEDELEAPPSGQGPPSDILEAEQTAELSTASEAEEEAEEQDIRSVPRIADNDIVLETPEPEEPLPAENPTAQEPVVNNHSENSSDTRQDGTAQAEFDEVEVPSAAGDPVIATKDATKPRRSSILQPLKTPASPRRSVVEVVIPVRRTPASALTKPAKGVALPKQPELVAPPKTPKRPGAGPSPSLPSRDVGEAGSAITRQPSLLSLAVSPEDYLVSIGKPATLKQKEALPPAPISPTQAGEEPNEIEEGPSSAQKREGEPAEKAPSPPASRVSSFFRSLQEASSSDSESSSEDDDGYLEEETLPQPKRISKAIKPTRRSSSPEGPSEDEAEQASPSSPVRSPSADILEHAADSSRILVPVEPPANSSVQTSPELQHEDETIPESSIDPVESDNGEELVAQDDPRLDVDSEPVDSAPSSTKPQDTQGVLDTQVETQIAAQLSEAHAEETARETSPFPIPSQDLQSSQSALVDDVMEGSPSSPISTSEAVVAQAGMMSGRAHLAQNHLDTTSHVDTPAGDADPVSSAIIDATADAVNHAAVPKASSSDPIEHHPSSSEPRPRTNSPDDSEPIKEVSSQLSNGISEVSRRPSPLDGSDSGTVAVHEAMMLDASENAPQTSSAILQPTSSSAVEEGPDSPNVQQNGRRSPVVGSRALAASPELFDSIRSFISRADKSSQDSQATSPPAKSNVPEVSVQPASVDRGQASSQAQVTSAVLSPTPRRSPRLAPSSPILPPTSSTATTNLYPDLSALQEETQNSQPSFAGVSSTDSISEPIQESSQIDELESQTQAAPPRFADVPTSSPIKRYDFDSASQIDALASQPPPATSESSSGNQSLSASQAIHAAVKRVTSLGKQGPPHSPANSTGGSDISASDSQDIQDTLVVKAGGASVPLFRPESSSSSEDEGASDEDVKNAGTATTSPVKSTQSRTSSVSSNSPPVAIYKLQSSPEREEDAEADTTIRNGPMRAIQGHPTSDFRSSSRQSNSSPKRETLSKIFLPPVLPGPPPPTASPRNNSKIIQPEPLGRITRAGRVRHSFGSLSELVEQRTRRGPRPSLASQLSQQSLEASRAAAARQTNGNEAEDSSSSSDDDSDEDAAASASSATSAIPANRFAGATRPRTTRSTRGRSSLARLSMKPGQRR